MNSFLNFAIASGTIKLFAGDCETFENNYISTVGIPQYSYSAFSKVKRPKHKKTKLAHHAAITGGSISPYPSDRQKL